MSDPPAILARMRGITKRFGPVTVLHDVPFDVRAGEAHVLAGENGAGKSTLIKILGGIHSEFSGSMELRGRPYRPRDPLDASRQGVAIIHQELSLVPFMSVADNVVLGRSPVSRLGFVDDRRQRSLAASLLKRLNVDLDVRRPVSDYPIATRQLVEIAKALSQNARVIVMDEPTSALSAPEVAKLFDLIRQLKHDGCGVVYITHRMAEIQSIADRITVLRDGRHVGTGAAADLPPDTLVEWMVGRHVEQRFLRHTPRLGSELLRVEDFSVHPHGLSRPPAVRGASLGVRAGEVLGIGGLQGSGASELLWGLFGAYGQRTQGRVLIEGHPVVPSSPARSIRNGIALVTNDRKAAGLILSASIIRNTTLADLAALSPGGWIRPRREHEAAEQATTTLGLRAASLDSPVASLSGGNQQKVVLAKWLQTNPRLLLLDEPTRGIDVAAKRDIYALMNEWTARGIAILLITSELPELLAISDRIMVLHRGVCTDRFAAGEATPARVVEAAMGRGREPASP